jgi:hypothetical protein
MDTFENLFSHPKWPAYQQALRERLHQLQSDLENRRPEGDHVTDYTQLRCTLREMATIRWMVDEVPGLLTQSEAEVQLAESDELRGGAHAQAEGAETAGQEAYDHATDEPDGSDEW